jgi:hypothetical protein
VDITVQFSPKTAQALQQSAAVMGAGEAGAARSGTPVTGAGEILNAVREAGATIEPLHPGSDDPQLNRYFVVRVRDARNAEELASRLRSFESTEAAYIKPHEEAP